jgi:hypothetical protein
MAEIRPYNPTWRDQIAGLLAGDRPSPERRAFVEGLLGSSGLGSTGVGLVDLTPAGIPLAAQEARNAAMSGDWLGAGLGAMAVLPAARVAGQGVRSAARAADEALASRNPRLYNLDPQPPRPFTADYPNGAETDAAGNLLRTIDGADIRARFVVGRRVAEGADEALPPAQFDAIAEASTGRVTETVAPGSKGLGRNDVGSVPVNKSSRRPLGVYLSDELTPDQLPKVYAHEIGHVVDQAAREIPVAGLDDQLRALYNTQNNPQTYGKLFGPEQNKYKGADVPRELMAEAVRAYVTDPNSIKTLYPEVAKRIREYVNRHPELSKIVQFNSVAGLLGAAAASAPGGEGPSN